MTPHPHPSHGPSPGPSFAYYDARSRTSSFEPDDPDVLSSCWPCRAACGLPPVAARPQGRVRIDACTCGRLGARSPSLAWLAARAGLASGGAGRAHEPRTTRAAIR